MTSRTLIATTVMVPASGAVEKQAVEKQAVLLLNTASWKVSPPMVIGYNGK